MEDAGIAVLRGNLAPRGAIIKPAAATPVLLQHVGPALVFDSIEDMRTRIDDPDLDVTPNTVLVLRGCGPRGYPGMPEVGNMPLPQKLLEQGVRDMVRISDARMSGTAYGTVILHVAPEAAAGGPLGVHPHGRHRHGRRGEPHPELRRDRRRAAVAQHRPRRARPRTPRRCAAGRSSTSTTSCKQTPAPTSTSWSGRAAPR